MLKLAAGALQFDVVWDVKIAEAKAIYHGMKIVKDLAFVNMVVESDSLVVIQAFRNKSGGLVSLV